MSFDSKSQQRKCYALKSKGEAGSWNCDEWSEKTDFAHLPEKASLETELGRKAARQSIQANPRPIDLGVDAKGTHWRTLGMHPDAVAQASSGMQDSGNSFLDSMAHKWRKHDIAGLVGGELSARSPVNQALLTGMIPGALGAGGALVGASLGAPVGAIAGIGRGRPTAGIGRGIVRGGATGLGAGLGMGAGLMLGGHLKANDLVTELLIRGLGAAGGLAGWGLSGKALGTPAVSEDIQAQAANDWLDKDNARIRAAGKAANYPGCGMAKKKRKKRAKARKIAAVPMGLPRGLAKTMQTGIAGMAPTTAQRAGARAMLGGGLGAVAGARKPVRPRQPVGFGDLKAQEQQMATPAGRGGVPGGGAIPRMPRPSVLPVTGAGALGGAVGRALGFNKGARQAVATHLVKLAGLNPPGKRANLLKLAMAVAGGQTLQEALGAVFPAARPEAIKQAAVRILDSTVKAQKKAMGSFCPPPVKAQVQTPMSATGAPSAVRSSMY